MRTILRTRDRFGAATEAAAPHIDVTGTTVGNKNGLDVNLVGSSGVSLGGSAATSFTSTLVTATGVALEITPVTDQKWIRLVPLAAGSIFYGDTSSVNTTQYESFSSAQPITIAINDSVWIITTGGSISVRVYRGA